MVTLKAKENQFKHVLQQEIHKNNERIGNGVRIASIVEDQTPFKVLFNPEHPDADEDGYVHLPNVDPLKEMVDLMGSTRSYEANVTALNASKGMLMKALEIGK